MVGKAMSRITMLKVYIILAALILTNALTAWGSYKITTGKYIKQQNVAIKKAL